MGIFGKDKQVSTRADGAKVTETKAKKVVKYPGGDLEITNKKTGAKESWVRRNADGTRERDGK